MLVCEADFPLCLPEANRLEILNGNLMRGHLAYSRPLNGKHKMNILCVLYGSAVTFSFNNRCLNIYCRISISIKKIAVRRKIFYWCVFGAIFKSQLL